MVKLEPAGVAECSRHPPTQQQRQAKTTASAPQAPTARSSALFFGDKNELGSARHPAARHLTRRQLLEFSDHQRVHQQRVLQRLQHQRGL